MLEKFIVLKIYKSIKAKSEERRVEKEAYKKIMEGTPSRGENESRASYDARIKEELDKIKNPKLYGEVICSILSLEDLVGSSLYSLERNGKNKRFIVDSIKSILEIPDTKKFGFQQKREFINGYIENLMNIRNRNLSHKSDLIRDSQEALLIAVKEQRGPHPTMAYLETMPLNKLFASTVKMISPFFDDEFRKEKAGFVKVLREALKMNREDGSKSNNTIDIKEISSSYDLMEGLIKEKFGKRVSESNRKIWERDLNCYLSASGLSRYDLKPTKKYVEVYEPEEKDIEGYARTPSVKRNVSKKRGKRRPMSIPGKSRKRYRFKRGSWSKLSI